MATAAGPTSVSPAAVIDTSTSIPVARQSVTGVPGTRSAAGARSISTVSGGGAGSTTVSGAGPWGPGPHDDAVPAQNATEASTPNRAVRKVDWPFPPRPNEKAPSRSPPRSTCTPALASKPSYSAMTLTSRPRPIDRWTADPTNSPPDEPAR